MPLRQHTKELIKLSLVFATAVLTGAATIFYLSFHAVPTEPPVPTLLSPGDIASWEQANTSEEGTMLLQLSSSSQESQPLSLDSYERFYLLFRSAIPLPPSPEQEELFSSKGYERLRIQLYHPSHAPITQEVQILSSPEGIIRFRTLMEVQEHTTWQYFRSQEMHLLTANLLEQS